MSSIDHVVQSQRPAEPRRWHFFRAGGIDQVFIRSGEDLANLRHLDQKLWMALSCPVRGLECDERTLALIDSDKDGIVRVPEFLRAIDWACQRLVDLDVLVDANENLPLDMIRSDTPAGGAIIDAAKAILENLGKPEAKEISVSETSRSAEVFSKAVFNGDGIVTPAAAGEDAALSQTIRDIIACTGGKQDRSSEMGVDKATVAGFYDELVRYASWSQNDAPEATPVGFEAYRKIKSKLDDYFSRCRLVAFDARAADPLNRNTPEFDAIADKDLSTLPDSVRALPLAQPRTDLTLDFTAPVNPAWSQEVADFRAVVLDKSRQADADRLSLEEWQELRLRFEQVETRNQELDSFTVKALPATRIQELLENDHRGKIEALIAEDESYSDEVAAIDDLDRLARYQRDLHLIARNFVNFADFFNMERAAIFQAGMLYIDSRACRLCVRVANPLAHATLASLSRCYILYCECTRVGESPIQIAAVLSNGDSDHLMVGRNGVFYDRKGNDWHARVVKIIENPISLRQAFWSPYKKFAKFIDAQISKRAEAAEKDVNDRLASAATSVTTADKTAASAPEPSKTNKIEVGTIAAISVAVGSIGTFLSIILVRAVSLGPWLPVALLCVMLMISLPSVVLAYIRLRQRTLGPILDANGWAINGQIRIRTKLARALTGIRRLPRDARRTMKHPGQDGSGGKIAAFVALAALVASLATAFWLYYTGRWTPSWQEKPIIEDAATPNSPLDFSNPDPGAN